MPQQFKNKIEGEYIELRRSMPDLEMAKKMFALVDVNREHLKKWFPWVKFTLKLEDTCKYLLEKEEKTRREELVEYALYSEEEYLGNISLFNIDWKCKSAEIGYWLSQYSCRKGYMTTAVKMLEKEAFECLGMNRIQIKCDEANEASAALARKCGYLYEGLLRDETVNEELGGYRSSLVFSKLKREFQKKL